MLLIYFYRPLRILLQDYDPSVRQYADTVLADGVRTAIQLNKIPGYTLTPAEDEVTPDISDPNIFALLVYHTARLFIAPKPDRGSFKTRAYSESWGSVRNYLQLIENDIDALENGDRFSSYQNYYTWLHGMAGLPLGELFAEFEADAPLWKATFTRDGMRVA